MNTNKVIGLINSIGISSLKSNPPLDPFSVEEVLIYTEFFIENNKYILNNPTLYTAFASGLKYCSDNNIDTEEFNLILEPMSGTGYNDILIKTIEHLELFDALKTFITTPSGILFSPERIALYKINNENHESYFNIGNIFPFEFSDEYIYLVVKIDGGNNEDNCDDRSFESISILNERERTLKQTFIRVASKNGRWSDWLEFTEDVFLNINTFKLFLETEILVYENIDKYSYEDTLCYNYIISFNLIKDNGELLTIDYNNETNYVDEYTFFYSLHSDYEVDLSYIKTTFMELGSNNINYSISYLRIF